jgi:transposase-like protein
MPEINAAIASVYFSGGNTRRIRGALAPLLKAAPLSKSAVSRIVGTLRQGLDTWQQRSLARSSSGRRAKISEAATS